MNDKSGQGVACRLDGPRRYGRANPRAVTVGAQERRRGRLGSEISPAQGKGKVRGGGMATWMDGNRVTHRRSLARGHRDAVSGDPARVSAQLAARRTGRCGEKCLVCASGLGTLTHVDSYFLVPSLNGYPFWWRAVRCTRLLATATLAGRPDGVGPVSRACVLPVSAVGLLVLAQRPGGKSYIRAHTGEVGGLAKKPSKKPPKTLRALLFPSTIHRPSPWEHRTGR